MARKRIRNPRVFVDTPPELKAAYTEFCRDVMKVNVSQRTRYLWREDMARYGEEDAKEETTAA